MDDCRGGDVSEGDDAGSSDIYIVPDGERRSVGRGDFTTDPAALARADDGWELGTHADVLGDSFAGCVEVTGGIVVEENVDFVFPAGDQLDFVTKGADAGLADTNEVSLVADDGVIGDGIEGTECGRDFHREGLALRTPRRSEWRSCEGED